MMERAFGIAAVAGPIIGLIVGTLFGSSRKNVFRYAVYGYLIGSLGLVAYLAWTVPKWRQHYKKYVKTPAAWRQDEPQDMKELITAEQAESGVQVLSFALAAIGALGIGIAWLRKRDQLVRPFFFAMFSALLIEGLWSAYNWHCRYDPNVPDPIHPEIGYFGLEKVRVLGLNFLMFVAVGVAMGALWAIFHASKGKHATKRA